MCDCTSCSFTDSFAKKTFADWPRGEPAGPRRSAADYAWHVRHSQVWGRGYDGVMHERKEVAEYIAQFEKLNGLKKQEPIKAPARPHAPAKAREHFPELDRQPETAKIYAMPKRTPVKEPPAREQRGVPKRTPFDKRPRGRPAMPGRRIVIKLREEQIRRAEKLGDGNVAQGIRKALEAA
jgi:hypothetical protein